MENASKALLMAGGILIAIIILTLLVKGYTNIQNMKQEEENEKKVEQIIKFNGEYEAYNKNLMYGLDVITVFNKAKDNNLKYENNDKYKISIKVINENGDEIQNDNLMDEENKNGIFKCTKITYSTTTGKVDSMTFQKI